MVRSCCSKRPLVAGSIVTWSAASVTPSWSNVTSMPVSERDVGGLVLGEGRDDADRLARLEGPGLEQRAGGRVQVESIDVAGMEWLGRREGHGPVAVLDLRRPGDGGSTLRPATRAEAGVASMLSSRKPVSSGTTPPRMPRALRTRDRPAGPACPAVGEGARLAHAVARDRAWRPSVGVVGGRLRPGAPGEAAEDERQREGRDGREDRWSAEQRPGCARARSSSIIERLLPRHRGPDPSSVALGECRADGVPGP